MEGRIGTLVEKEIFSPIDAYFAKMLVKEDSSCEVLVGYLLAMARQGHLCIQIKDNKVTPHPSILTEDAKEADDLEKELINAFSKLSSSFYEKILDETRLPSSPLCLFENRLYLQKNWVLEKEFLNQIKRLQERNPFLNLNPLEISSSCNKEQALALQKALSSPISVISGGPGTGKTFTAIEIVRAFFKALPEGEKDLVRVRLAAPTGKAAALLEKNMMGKLGSLSGVTCGTLHSFLKVGFQQDTFKRSFFADLLLIDESSMLDAKLFVRLLSSLQEGGRVVLMGDKDQLPPVESGGFFADLIDLAETLNIPVTLLQKSVRVEKIELQNLAEIILKQDFEKIREREEVKIVTSFKDKSIKEVLEKECRTHFSFPYQESCNFLEHLKGMEKFRILSPIRKGPFGVDALNQMILKAFIHNRLSEDKLICPILITENDATRSLMNGDTGILVAKISSLKKGIFTAEDRAYFFSKEQEDQTREFSATVLPLFTFAYCLSVHKSQGSEYESVLVMLPPGSEKFGKEVLYTAVTRAKKKVFLI
ncbi:MAG: exodeoxyribonuclease V subunit alpha, partial [Verrucomicrobia bacterium]|nr:exodeoxyribonuclease V subunit alpha [Verrucomicrobiota bacterium]